MTIRFLIYNVVSLATVSSYTVDYFSEIICNNFASKDYKCKTDMHVQIILSTICIDSALQK